MFRALVNLKLVNKVMLPVAVMTAVIVGIVWYATDSLGQMSATADQVVDQSAERLALVLELANSVNASAVDADNAILAEEKEDIAHFISDATKKLKAAHERADRLAKLPGSDAQWNQAIKRKLDAFGDALQLSFKAVATDKRNAYSLMTNDGTEALSAVQQITDQALARDRQELAAAKQAADDRAREAARSLIVISIAAIALIIGGLGGILIFQVVRPLNAIAGLMDRLAHGDETIEIVGTERKDEVGLLARALQVFKTNAGEIKRLEGEQALAKRQAEEEKRQTMQTLAATFEAEVGNIVLAVSNAAKQMQASAKTLSSNVDKTSQRSSSVSAASEEATANVETVAAAAEELASSIAEIGRQVEQSNRIADRAVQDAAKTDELVHLLAQSAEKIGDVVQLISGIAGQTNLLALNATIEAARAGDAGKGFAVVASEVKSLATQTARATDDISTQIAAIQQTTQVAVEAISAISATISEMSEIAASIAAAIEEQSAATREISRNVQQAAAGTSDVSSNISGVNEAAVDLGMTAAEVLATAGELSRQSDQLSTQVQSFVAQIKKS
jgi:methyl-accepting chemotaxis protein